MRTIQRLVGALLGLSLAREAGAAEPERVWGTYIGGEAYESLISSAAFDEAGNIYVAGGTSSEINIGTPGTHMPTKLDLGSDDFYLMKFDPSGQRVWGTYYGGPGSEGEILGLAARGGKVVLSGSAASKTDMATPGAFDTEISGITDGVVACFTTDGALVWGTYIGGMLGMSNEDVANDVAIDAGGDVFVAGVVSDGSGVASPGAHQTGYGGGTRDAFLMRLGDQGQRIWGTLYGGSGNDLAFGVSLAAGDAVYVGGQTSSATKIATPGASQAVKSGMSDGFVARFDSSGARAWGTYFGGDAQDIRGEVAALPDGGVVFMNYGQSAGLATPGTHQQVPGGEGDTYVVRFDAAGDRVWSTYLGGEGSDYSLGLAVAPSGAIFVSGDTLSTTGMATPNAYQTLWTFRHGFLTKFDGDGQRVWGTYYGGSDSETEFVRVAVFGDRVLLSGDTYADTGMATPGAHKSTREATDNFLALFRDGDGGLACVDADACSAGFCVDGVCCDRLCDGACEACSAAAGAAYDGICGAIGEVECRPAAGACDVPEVCDGQSTACPEDQVIPDGTACDDGLCEAGVCAPGSDASTGDESTTTDASTSTTAITTTTGTTHETTPETTLTGGPTATSTVDTTSSDPAPTGTGGGGSGSGDDDTADVGPSPTSDPGPATTGGADETTSGDLPEATDAGCGCASAAASPAIGLLLLGLRRRRRGAARRGA